MRATDHRLRRDSVQTEDDTLTSRAEGTTASDDKRPSKEGRPVVAKRVQRRLEMQGFACSSDSAFEDVVPWLRLAPGLTTVFAAIGTALASPAILVTLALVTGLCAGTHRHPFDFLYTHGIRRVIGTRALPRNEAPRRFACGLATAWLVTTALVFWSGAVVVGYALGVSLVALGGLVATTHFCFGSFVYQLIHRRLVGHRFRA